MSPSIYRFNMYLIHLWWRTNSNFPFVVVWSPSLNRLFIESRNSWLRLVLPVLVWLHAQVLWVLMLELLVLISLAQVISRAHGSLLSGWDQLGLDIIILWSVVEVLMNMNYLLLLDLWCPCLASNLLKLLSGSIHTIFHVKLVQVERLANWVRDRFLFLASVACLPVLEVVVEAVGTGPTSFREAKVWLVFGEKGWFGFFG